MQKKAKIALVSCHKDPNYGSMLQAYALAAAIRKEGKEAEYLDYRTCRHPKMKDIPKRIIKRLFPNFFLRRNNPEFAFLYTKQFASTIQSYHRFHETYIPYSTHTYYYDTARYDLDVDLYDSYIIGSDQLWSPFLYTGRNPYFLDFADMKKKNAYAPSLGTIDVPDSFKNVLKEKLQSFTNISCREYANSRMLTDLLGREVCHVLDPTLLLDSADWDKIASFPDMPSRYILAYILGERDEIIHFAEKLGKERKLPVYYIVTRPKYLHYPHILEGVSPNDFIGLIKHAAYIVTDSFHGCLFSINYNKQFFAFCKRSGDIHTNDNMRIFEFLQMVGAEYRLQNLPDACLLPDHDYTLTNQEISKMRGYSINFLKKCI